MNTFAERLSAVASTADRRNGHRHHRRSLCGGVRLGARSIVNGPHIGRFAFGVTASDSIEIDRQKVPVTLVKEPLASA